MEQAAPRHRRIVEGAVEAAEAFECGIDEVSDILADAHVARDISRVVAFVRQRFDEVVQGVFGAGGEHDRRALAGEHARSIRPDACAGPDNENDLAVEQATGRAGGLGWVCGHDALLFVFLDGIEVRGSRDRSARTAR